MESAWPLVWWLRPYFGWFAPNQSQIVSQNLPKPQSGPRPCPSSEANLAFGFDTFLQLLLCHAMVCHQLQPLSHSILCKNKAGSGQRENLNTKWLKQDQRILLIRTTDELLGDHIVGRYATCDLDQQHRSWNFTFPFIALCVSSEISFLQRLSSACQKVKWKCRANWRTGRKTSSLANYIPTCLSCGQTYAMSAMIHRLFPLWKTCFSSFLEGAVARLHHWPNDSPSDIIPKHLPMRSMPSVVTTVPHAAKQWLVEKNKKYSRTTSHDSSKCPLYLSFSNHFLNVLFKRLGKHLLFQGCDNVHWPRVLSTSKKTASASRSSRLLRSTGSSFDSPKKKANGEP